jgi:diaminopimelate dehydrogenase
MAPGPADRRDDAGVPRRGAGLSLRVAVVGLGRLGTACTRALAAAPELALEAVALRPGSASGPAPRGLPQAVRVCEAGTLRDVDAALLCIPGERVLDVGTQLLSRGVPIVEAAEIHGLASREHREAIQREALRHRLPAVVGAGWDPGMLPLIRGWFALLVPKGRSRARPRPAASLHHTSAARDVPGVRDALCSELRESGGRERRYVYVELEPGADVERVSGLLRADPLFLGAETTVIPVESVAALEEEGHGVVLERWGEAAGVGHQRLLLEARFDRVALTAEVMLAAARALPGLAPGAHTLLDLAASPLFGRRSAAASEARP